MRRRAALALAVLAVNAHAATEYVSDELVLGVYAEQNQQGQRLTTLHSGTSVEALSTSGEYTQVRLADGTIGWVKSTYLTTREPATARVKQLEEELDRSRATTPALAEAAAHSEVERLQRELAEKEAQISTRPISSPQPAAAARISAAGVGAVLIAAACGFWLGYATLARRIRRKFGGLRVY
ncbi:MAG: TIGR04211 family SH3 domain-containing protein [Steroidobacteraceae bacterium]